MMLAGEGLSPLAAGIRRGVGGWRGPLAPDARRAMATMPARLAWLSSSDGGRRVLELAPATADQADALEKRLVGGTGAGTRVEGAAELTHGIVG